LEKVFVSAGSDSHGDFNYETSLDIDKNFFDEEGACSLALVLLLTNKFYYSTDNALGKLATIAWCPNGVGKWGENVLKALRDGHTVVSDGPIVVFGIDRDGNGSIDDPDDVHIGDTFQTDKQKVTLSVAWATNEELGQIKEIRVIRGTADGESSLSPIVPLAGEWSGKRRIQVDAPSDNESVIYYRLEAETESTPNPYVSGLVDETDIYDSYHCFTNPIWIVRGREWADHGDDREPDNNSRDGGTLVKEQASVSGILCPERDEDYFTFDAVKGQIFSIRTIARDLNPPSDADTLLTLFDSNGNVLAENDDYGGSLDSLLIFAAPVTGRYYIRVSNAVDGGGPNYIYHLVVTRLSSSTISSEPPLDDYSTAPVSVEAIGAVTPIVPTPLLRSGTLLPATHTQSLANRVGVIHSNPGAKTIVADSVQKPRAHTSGKGREPPCCKE
jgi:hypothetical protein